MLTLGILEGDDIGLEVVPECIKVMKEAAARTGLDIAWKPVPIARRAHEQFGHTVPPGTLEEFTAIALELRQRVELPARTRYRLVGVGLANFRHHDEMPPQPGLFDPPK